MIAKAFSVRAPWWWAILRLGKGVENRTREWKHRGPVLIHASKWWNDGEVRLAALSAAYAAGFHAGSTGEEMVMATLASMKERGGYIVGRADIVGCHFNGDTPSNTWEIPGQWGIELANVRAVEPFPYKGALGLFNVDVPDGHPRSL